MNRFLLLSILGMGLCTAEFVEEIPTKRPDLSLAEAVRISHTYISEILGKDEVLSFFPYEAILVGGEHPAWYVSFMREGGVRYRFRVSLDNAENWYRVYPKFVDEQGLDSSLPTKIKLPQWKESQ